MGGGVAADEVSSLGLKCYQKRVCGHRCHDVCGFLPWISSGTQIDVPRNEPDISAVTT